jgi:DNA ligase-1
VLAAAADELKSVYVELPNYELILAEILRGGLMGLHERCHIHPGIPVKPMLAKPTKGIRVVLDRFTNIPFTCEYKYDGERAQVTPCPCVCRAQ